MESAGSDETEPEQNLESLREIAGGFAISRTHITLPPLDLRHAANGASGFCLSQSLENIQEFHVEGSTYSAEFGRGTGGQVTITTKSGSNGWHGSLFEYVRNDWFDARNYFDHGAKQAQLRLNQFGGSIGGKILKDKLFLFASQENLAQRVYVTFRQTTLSDFACSQAVPAIRPLLAAFPAGQSHTVDNFQDIVSGTLSSYMNENFGNIRFDYLINNRHTLCVRYSREHGEAVSPSDISGSGTFDGLNFEQLDASLAKDFAITERTRFNLRWDVYNIFNHPNFSNPPSVLGGGLPSAPGATGIQPGQPFNQVLAGSAFGGLSSTVGKLVNFGTARQMQVSARFNF